jgi:putative aminopeptidase FrvX
MQSADLLDIIRSILAQPTAPFHEDAVRAEILIQLAQCPHVTAEQDDFGNVVAQYRRGDGAARFAFAAHMDHPGYVFDPAASEGAEPETGGGNEPTTQPAAISGTPLSSTFLGGVPREYREKNPPTRDFGAFAMWDLPSCELREGRIHSRACDDLIGCSAIVALFRELEEREAEASVYGMFTRAEEVGFVGAIRLAQSGIVPRTVTVISLETSSEKGGPAKMGEGVVVRVGDRTSIFDAGATATLVQFAKAAEIPSQRCLMSGGTCEGTAYQLYGYRCAALCVALGNYHNCGPETQIAPEFVSLEDVTGMVRLMVHAVISPEPPDPHAALREKLEKSANQYARFV